MPVDWEHLGINPARRATRGENVRKWMKDPKPENAAAIVKELLALAIGELVLDSCRKTIARGTELEDRRKGFEDQLERDERAAGDWAHIVCSELKKLVKQDKDAARAVLESTVHYWRGRRQKFRKKSDVPTLQNKADESTVLDSLVERCADQLAAALIFKNLHRYEEMRKELWWDDVVYRAADRVILAPRTGRSINAEGMVRDLIALMLEKSHKDEQGCSKFTHKNVGSSIRYFQSHFFEILRKNQSDLTTGEFDRKLGSAPGDERDEAFRTKGQEHLLQFPVDPDDGGSGALSSKAQQRLKEQWEWLNKALINRDNARHCSNETG
jgi:hypothetical protein